MKTYSNCEYLPIDPPKSYILDFSMVSSPKLQRYKYNIFLISRFGDICLWDSRISEMSKIQWRLLELRLWCSHHCKNDIKKYTATEQCHVTVVLNLAINSLFPKWRVSVGQFQERHNFLKFWNDSFLLFLDKERQIDFHLPSLLLGWRHLDN